TAGLLLAALTTLGLFVYLRMAQSLVDAIDNALRNAASQVVAELVVEGDDLVAVDDDFIIDLSTSPLLEQGFSFSVLNNRGQIVEGFGPYQKLPRFNLATFSPQQDAFNTFTDAATGHSVRVYSSLVTARGQMVGMFQVAQHMNSAEQTLNQVLISLLVTVPLVVTIAGVGG
ncbi:MAG: sensor histidine kinase N-terminal domain-containing protein, partial [Anaerolineae bacterium]|nr:sensor histidine kinase N-terminal domain-containing protein [Anaerolineae bacterium]